MKAVEIKKGIYWVGGIDWSLRNFHGYLTQRGSTYNSYLIVDDKITLIDNVKSYLADELISRISEIVDPAKIDYIIQNHIEMDHSGSLPEMLKLCPQATVYASPQGIQGLGKHYQMNCNVKAVKSGDILKLGKRTLHFVQTPMVHWPDNMVTYCPEEKLIFSNDAFGQHIASSERFDDEYPLSSLLHEAEKYYANIVLPFGKQVQKALEVVGSLDIETICPSHGLIWRSHIDEIIKHYIKWSHNEVEEKALIIFDTMWKSTEKMAYAIQDAFEQENFKTRLINLQHHHISDIMTEVLTAKYICVGSPTLNNNIMPTVAGFLTYLKGLAPKNRHGLAFGSYGWSGQSVGIVEDTLKDCGFRMMEQIKLQYIPSKEDIEAITENIKKNIQH